MSVIEQIQRRKLSQQVYERLMDLIGSGKIAPGEQLPSERDLMERFGVGRPAVREALQTLDRAGIITITHGERARVAVPTADSLISQVATGAQHLLRTRPGSLEHLKEARLFLETGLARLAAVRADAQGLADLAARLEEHRHATTRIEEFVGRDIAFHRQIALMTGNPIFAATLEAMLKWLSAYYRALVRAPGAESLTLAEHQRIYDAIAARDPAAAEAAMRDHLTRANTLYRSLLTRETEEGDAATTMATTEALMLFGTGEPPAPRETLTAGPLTCVLEQGAIRDVRWHGVEVLRGVAYLLRDRDWATPPAAIDALAIERGADGFTVTYGARFAADGHTLRCQARITATAEGRFAFAVEGIADGAIETNRCGFVVLHPAGFAGMTLEVRHTDGTIEPTRFPETISPGQPAFDIRALRYQPRDGLDVTCTLEAELAHDPRGRFEMEDQRNWSDASFKTSVGWLLDPGPYRREPHRSFPQRVSLSIADSRPEAAAAARAPDAPQTLLLGEASDRRMPAIGIFAGPAVDTLTEQEVARLDGLRPGWVGARVELDGYHQWQQLAAARAIAARLGAALHLELIVPGTDQPDAEVAEGAALCARAEAEPASVLVCPAPLLKSYQPSGPWPDLPPLEAYYAAARARFPKARIGGGMATYFTELNRRRPTGEGIDFICHSTTPIIHAADDISVMETLETLPHIARSVRAIWPDLPYRVGPSSLPMRSNPYGSEPVRNEAGTRVALADRDPRQSGLFAAAWTVGYAAALAREGLEVLTLHHTNGPSGVIANTLDGWHARFPEAVVRPVFHVVRALAGSAGAAIVPVTAPAGIAVVAWKIGRGIAALAANLTGDSRTLALDGWRARVLDTASFPAAVSGTGWLNGPHHPAESLTLGPYATAFLGRS